MYALGLPIVQGAISTILGVIGLALAPSYIFLTFFKMIMLVIVLGALHGLILLPVLLSFLGPGTCCGQSDDSAIAPNANGASGGSEPRKLQQQTQTNLHEMKIPRPKHSCSRHENNDNDFKQQQHHANGFHSDNYLQAASKNKKISRTSANSAASQPIKLQPMYTNRAFQD